MNQLSIRKMKKLATKKKKGFTLIELIIVIAIIAIIAAIAIPKFGQVKENANLASDEANAKIIATSVVQAISDGATVENGVVAESVYKNYIDGGVPKTKTTGADRFKVVYKGTSTDEVKDATGKITTPAADAGTIITLVDSTGAELSPARQVYPIKK